jgi:hypothetical protein
MKPKRSKGADARLPRKYEGPGVLGELLTASGCELTVDEVVEEFQAAVEEGSTAPDVIPLLWELEPAFGSPDQARRTFSNLFGLWDAVAADAVADLVPLGDLIEDPAAPLSPRFVDAAWRRLDDLDGKDWRRARDQFDNVQAELGTFVFEALRDADPVAQEVAMDQAFETWWILREARGSVPRPDRATLRAALEAEDAAEAEPALGVAATTALWEQVADDEHPLPEGDVATVERVLRAVRCALSPRG